MGKAMPAVTVFAIGGAMIRAADNNRLFAALLGTIHHHDYPGPVQHREDAHELLVEEQVSKEPRAHIQGIGATHDRRVVIGGERHRERVNVHDEDAQGHEKLFDATKEGKGIGAAESVALGPHRLPKRLSLNAREA